MNRSDGFWNDLADFVEESQAERKNNTDRGFVLVQTAMLDELLQRLIAAFLIDDDKLLKPMFQGPSAPLGSFSSRIVFATALGLITRKDAECLDLIREIRNDYAHRLSNEILSRDNKTAKSHPSRMKKLFEKLPSPSPWTFDTSKTFKEEFYRATFVMMMRLRDRFNPTFDIQRVELL